MTAVTLGGPGAAEDRDGIRVGAYVTRRWNVSTWPNSLQHGGSRPISPYFRPSSLGTRVGAPPKHDDFGGSVDDGATGEVDLARGHRASPVRCGEGGDVGHLIVGGLVAYQ